VLHEIHRQERLYPGMGRHNTHANCCHLTSPSSVQTAIHGESFLPACRDAFFAIARNILRIGALHVVAGALTVHICDSVGQRGNSEWGGVDETEYRLVVLVSSICNHLSSPICLHFRATRALLLLVTIVYLYVYLDAGMYDYRTVCISPLRHVTDGYSYRSPDVYGQSLHIRNGDRLLLLLPARLLR